MQSICNNYMSYELMQLIFEQIPVQDLFNDRTVSKDWHRANNMNEVCSIIEIIHKSAIQTLRSKNKQGGRITICFIKDTLNQRAFVPFNIYDHISFLEKAKHGFNWCGDCFLIFKTIITIHLFEAIGLISKEYANEVRIEVYGQS